MTAEDAANIWPELEAAAQHFNIPLGSAACSTCASCAAGLVLHLSCCMLVPLHAVLPCFERPAGTRAHLCACIRRGACGALGTSFQWWDNFFALCPTCQVDFMAIHICERRLMAFDPVHCCSNCPEAFVPTPELSI